MIPSADEYFRKIHQTLSLLDANNIRIIRSMKKHGPRNLQLIARDTGIPYPTVFARVSRLEKGGGIFRSWANPNHARIGLSRAMVLVSPMPGKDLLAREALKIPGYWIRIIRSMGEC
ncbi:MAG TPA: Lrp/AsnC family transcriptional regulator, partial [Candidatus Binatus sp.]|nr:Lrp/AsnC family transcriptional regulator [Candidatus Binatus sp.]